MNYGANLSIDLPASQAFLQLDSKSRIPGQPINKCEITKYGHFFSMNKSIRYSLQYTSFFWAIKNVTSRNNKIKFFVGATEYNATMPIGFYNLSAFITAFQTALNSALAGFTVTDSGAIDGHRIRVQHASAYRPVSSGQVRSPWEMAGFDFTDQTKTYTDHYGYAKLWYTRYIDVVSYSLNRYQNIPDESSNFPTSNVLIRIFGDDGDSTNAIREDITSPITQPHAISFSSDLYKWVQYAREGSSQGLGSNIDITLLDEYGAPVETDNPYTYPEFSLVFLTRSLE